MKRKVWELTVLDNPNRAVGGESDIFYTTDTEAFLIFRLTDADFNPATATLTLVNTSDKSVISESVPVIDKEIEWEMTEDAIVHSGNWQAQLVYTQEKDGKPERYTAPVIQFDVQNHLLTGRQPSLVAIEDWNTFMADAQELLAQLEDDADGIFINIDELEQQYRDNEQARADAEDVRETNESTRQAEESQREASEQQREENESLRESSETDRVSAEQNRVTAENERNDLYNLVQQKLENGEFVGEKGDTGDGLEYVWNGTQLGVRKEGETEYVYVDLKGDKGDTGEIENLDSSHIVDALGYMPISAADVPEPTKENVGLGNVDNVKQASKVEHDQLASDFSAHQAEKVHQGEIHGMRITDDKFEFFNGTEWIVVKGGIPVGNVQNLSANQLINEEIEIKWQDPEDKTLDGVFLAEWKGTQVVRKEGNYPVDITDGELVVNNTTKNQYSDNGYIDSGLTDGKTYYYMLFPYTDEIETIDGANRVSETAILKFTQSAPSAPNVTDIGHDKATVNGGVGTQVRLEDGTWYDSPRTFTGLNEQTSYTAYARRKETTTHYASPQSSGRTFVTPSSAPGPSNLIAGTMQAGFFGEVPASELFTASQIASACGITQGTAQHENEPWLKFAYEGKILFRPRKAIRHSISWDAINTAKCVYGDSDGKIVTKDGKQYRVRLMRGALTDPSRYGDSDRGAKGSEWNKLMLPIHERSIDKSWAYPAYVEDNVPIWAHNLGTGTNGMYSDADLMTHYNHGDGSYVWQQETPNNNASSRVNRGYNGVSYSNSDTSSTTIAHRGWAPVLELL